MKHFCQLLFCLLFAPVQAQVNLTSSNLPIIIINTNGQDIPQEPKITAEMQVLYKGPGLRNEITDPPLHYNGFIGIEKRGSTSDFFSDKKPYSVETRDADGNDLDMEFLGMPKESDWAFIAPYSDKTLIREALMYNLARRIMPWAPRARFAELVLNGDYQGVYMVTERIKRDKNRVNISKLKATDTAGDSLTGGYILKLDKTGGTPAPSWESPFPCIPGAWQHTLWQVHYPKMEDIQPEQFAYIQQWITDFETVMHGPAFNDPDSGYTKYLDAGSFVDFTLLNEFAKNVDGYRLSTFMYKDRDDKDSLLHAGPVWDFNIAFGNCNYCGADVTSGWQVFDFNQLCSGDDWVNQFWWTKLWEDLPYRKSLRDRWKELRAGPLSTDTIMYVIDSLTNLLQESQERNFQRWPVLDTWIWPNVYCCGPYQTHVSFLKSWIESRLAWMDGTAETLYVGEYDNEKYAPTLVYPNPSSDVLNFRMYLHYKDRVYIRIFNTYGQLVENIPFVPDMHGESVFTWQHQLNTGIYFYEITVNGKRESRGRFVVK